MAETWKVKNRRWHANLGMASAFTLGLIALSCPFIAHKWDGGVGKALKTIHYGEFLPNNLRWIWIDSQGLFLVLLVVSGWLMHKKVVKQASRAAADDPKAAGSSVTVVDWDGGGRGVAMVSKAQARGLRAFLCPAAEFKNLTLEQERWLVFTGTADLGEVGRMVVAHLGSARPGSLKRLEYAMELAGDAGSTALVSALESAGARPLQLSATTPAAWSAQLLALLSGRSKTGASGAGAGASSRPVPVTT